MDDLFWLLYSIGIIIISDNDNVKGRPLSGLLCISGVCLMLFFGIAHVAGW